MPISIRAPTVRRHRVPEPGERRVIGHRMTAQRMTAQRMIGLGPNRSNQAGYSLLEVLIAMAILAIAIAITIPTMSAMYERHQVRQAFAATNAWMLDTRTGARLSGTAIDIPVGPIALSGSAATDQANDMPRDWQLEILQPWRVHPSGACEPARLRIASPSGRIWERDIRPPQCRADFRVEARIAGE